MIKPNFLRLKAYFEKYSGTMGISLDVNDKQQVASPCFSDQISFLLPPLFYSFISYFIHSFLIQIIFLSFFSDFL